MEPPLSVTQLTRTSPATTPLGCATRRAVAAVVFTAVLKALRTIPADGVEPIVQVRVAGERSAFPAASLARTLKVCCPSASPSYVLGDAHVVKDPASSWHSNVEPASLEVNSKAASAVVTTPLGPAVMVVSGGDASAEPIVQVRVAGER